MTADISPEKPLDELGTGMDENGNPVRRPVLNRTVRLRIGYDVNLATPQMPTKWGRLIEEQWREEELNQAVGRLRPVFRSDTPVAFLATSIIPEGLIVDRICTLDDIIKTEGCDILSDARQTFGVVDSSALGYDCEEFIERNWTCPGFTPMRWVDCEGIIHKSLFLSSWGDEWDSLCSAVAATGRDQSHIVSFDVGKPNSLVAKLIERDVDKVSKTFLSDEDQDALEGGWSDFVSANPDAMNNYAVERIAYEREWVTERFPSTSIRK
jgi:hypothetical protein